MIKRIIGAGILLCLFIAIPLSIAGITHVEIGSAFMGFLKSCNRDLENFKIEIPQIPQIPRFENPSGFFVVVDILVSFINGISQFINFGIMISNYFIQLLEFITIILINLVSMRNILWS